MRITIPFIDYRVSVIIVYSVCEWGLMLRCNRYTTNCDSRCGIAEQYVSGWSQFAMAASRSSLINDWSVDCNATNLGLIEVTFPVNAMRYAIWNSMYALDCEARGGEHCVECIRILGVCYIDNPELTNTDLMICWLLSAL